MTALTQSYKSFTRQRAVRASPTASAHVAQSGLVLRKGGVTVDKYSVVLIGGIIQRDSGEGFIAQILFNRCKDAELSWSSTQIELSLCLSAVAWSHFCASQIT